jgi:iron(III) transport system ATP-binding protein
VSSSVELRDVTVRRGGREALSAVTLSVPAGEVVSVLGASGSGKTTLLRVVAGFSAPDSGSVRIDGGEVTGPRRIGVPPEARGVGMVFQDLALWPHLTVRGNLAFGLQARKVPRAERDERIRDMLERVGLGGKEARYPGELSGGERQRVAVARALVLRPRVLLLDEPLANLDPGLRRELLALFAELVARERVTTLQVTHEPRDVEALGGTVAVLDAGRVVHAGTLGSLHSRTDLPFARDAW